MKKISIIIVNYNVKYFLEQALLSVKKAITTIDAEVWVVDNNSVDGSVEMVQENFKWVHLIANKENTGFSKANNQAIKQSNSEYILLLNPDTVLQEDTLQLCIDFMDKHADAGALGVRMIDGKGKFLPESKRGLPTPAVALYKMTGLSKVFPNSKTFGKYHLKYLSEFDIHEIDVLSGAFMFMRKSALDKVGLLDEQFFMYGEDIDLSYRITQGGYKNYYYPKTTIIHYKGESTKKKSANYVKVFYNAMVIFARKHYSNRMAGWFAFFINVAIWLRAFLANTFRFVEKILFPILDFTIIYFGFFVIAKYWELYNKYVHGFYPKEYYSYHIPIYILIVLIGIFLSGGYDKPLSAKRLVRGALAGSLLVFAMYAFLPKNAQFSRAILGLGCFWACVSPVIIRIVNQIIFHKQLSLNTKIANRILVIAAEKENTRVQELLSKSMVPYDFYGSLYPTSNKPLGYIGNINQFEDIVEIFNINLIIFSAADMSSKKIMELMHQYNQSEIQFKIIPENSYFIIGSNNKNHQGDWFTVDIQFALNNPVQRRKKRIFDLFTATISLLFFFVFIFKNRWFIITKNSLAIILGKKTLVGYSANADANLPKIKQGIFTTVDIIDNKELSEYSNFSYAKDYSIGKDVDVWWNGK